MERYGILKYGFTSGEVLEDQNIRFNFDKGEMVIVEHVSDHLDLSSYRILKMDRSDFFFGEKSDFDFIDIEWIELGDK